LDNKKLRTRIVIYLCHGVMPSSDNALQKQMFMNE
jgi:hypothetical protein